MTTQPPDSPPRVVVRSVLEPEPGPRLGALLDDYWPAYRRWIDRAEPLPAERCVARLERHMPELMPAFERLLALGPPRDRDRLARFLTLHRPPPVVRGCSQAVLLPPHAADAPVLVRNYDHAPHLFDGVVLSSRWLGTPVIAVTDCLWGALDGVNAHGLAVALAFGGRPDTGDGFGAQLIVRYLLETCRTTAQARDALARLPVYMAYTFVIVDPSGAFTTAFCGPDRPATFHHTPASTNHQERVEWPAYAAHCRSVARLEGIESLVADPARTTEDFETAFLRPPLYRTDYARASGTIYTATYRTTPGTLSLRWPDARMSFGFDNFPETEHTVTLGTPLARSR